VPKRTSGALPSKLSFTVWWKRGNSSRRLTRSAFMTFSMRLKPEAKALGLSLKARKKPCSCHMVTYRPHRQQPNVNNHTQVQPRQVSAVGITCMRNWLAKTPLHLRTPETTTSYKSNHKVCCNAV